MLPQEEFVLILDADMVMRRPFIPEELGARRGTAISAYYGCASVEATTGDPPPSAALRHDVSSSTTPASCRRTSRKRCGRSAAAAAHALHAAKTSSQQGQDPSAQAGGEGEGRVTCGRYLVGVGNALALKHVPEVLPRNDTLAGPMGRRGDQVPRPPPCPRTAPVTRPPA